MVHRKLLCTGDPILDIYISKTGNMITCDGGALNVYQNIRQLSENLCEVEFLYPNESECTRGDIFTMYTIVKRPTDDFGYTPAEIPLVSEPEREAFYTPYGIANVIAEYEPDILVLADYNKGTLNTSDSVHLPEIKYTVVDTRYKSLDLYWIETSRTKIWHATGKEYNSDYAKYFDWVFWTNGKDPVHVIYGKTGESLFTSEVPQETPVVNTCGAGDTFTATIAAALINTDTLNKQVLKEITELAIGACQDVIQKPYTSTTSLRLNNNVYNKLRRGDTFT